MESRALIDNLLLEGKKKMDQLEVFLIKNKEIEIGIFNGEVDKYSISESAGLSLRGTVDNKMGYSYTEKIDETSLHMLITETYENAKYIDTLEGDEIFKGSLNYENIQRNDNKLSNSDIATKIEIAKNLEAEALALDKRVVSVQMCGYKEFYKERTIINTLGVDLSDKTNGAVLYISVMVKENEDVKTGLAFKAFTDLSQVDYKAIAKEAVEEAISMLGATSIESGNYPIIIKNTVFANILEAFSSVFSADNVQKGLSLLTNKIGETVANEIVNVIDNPFFESGFGSKSFDDEGTSTKCKKVIHNGILTSYLHTRKTAKKDGIESTGNGFRSSYKSSLSISPSNFYIENGEEDFKHLISTIDHGIYIINVDGLHSGLNPVSGDFSLSAHGYEITDGKIGRPINQIAIAGNLYEVLKNIDGIANDLDFTFPATSYFGSPSIKISSLSIAGE